MTLHGRLTMAAAVAVAVAMVLVAVSAFFIVDHDLYHALDVSLRHRTVRLADHIDAASRSLFPTRITLPSDSVAQIVGPTGVIQPLGLTQQTIPIAPQVAQVAQGNHPPLFYRANIAGQPMEVLAVPVLAASALEVATPISSINNQLHDLAILLAILIGIGIALAATLGWLVSRTALLPLDRLTATMETVAETTDLSKRIEVKRQDELGRLGKSFNRLLEAVQRSRQTQRQLVEDAAHELRTPLTSIRTNAEVIREIDRLSPAEAEQLISDIVTQVEELSDLVGNLVELSREEESPAAMLPIDLDEVVWETVHRAEAHARTKQVTISKQIYPCKVLAVPQRLARAIANLLDNALKWSPVGGTIEITCQDGRITVSDHGPGIAPEDLPYVFDRFYRAPSARQMPGSGLGLAIVRQVVESCKGTVTISTPPEGGTTVQISIPTLTVQESSSLPDDEQ
ncbi:MAG: HAMP domain-containing histidine kinase [Actinobacteria bacterium]|jgi:two-component system sensor histidine kinase MprB|nr:HAMP domain-containing histidine kinase [Actinomycetota bacterium]MCL6095995.1 HAMP domain-containing histidine kinase [Actinomycetota bacterium]